MLSAILCLIVLCGLVPSHGSSLEHFNNVTDSWAKENISLLPYSGLEVSIGKTMSDDEAAEYCASQCLRYLYLCHSFLLFEIIGSIGGSRWCIVLSTLGTKFSGSQVRSSISSRNALAVYEQKATPSEQELIQRFSFEDPKHVSEKYGISQNFMKFSIKVLKNVQRALHGKLPTAVNIEKWLIEKDIPTSKLYLGKDFKREIMQGLQSWKSWPEHTDAPMQFTNLVVLTFLEIFFTSLDQGIQTIFDPVAKILIVEGSETHMLIHSFGPGEFVILTARNSIEKGILEYPMWYVTSNRRSKPDMKILNLFGEAMNSFGHKVSLVNVWDISLHLCASNQLQLGANIVANVIDRVLFNAPLSQYGNSVNALHRDIVTAIMSNVFDEYNLQRTLYRKLQKASFQSKMLDLDVITQDN